MSGVVLLALWGGTASPADPGSAALEAEVARQEAIYRSQGENVPSGYVVDRSLLAYAAVLPAEFDRALAALGPADRWLDVGAGEGKAILDYYSPRFDSMHPEGRERRGGKAQAIAISIEDRRTPRWKKTAASLGNRQIQYFSGRRLREYTVEELGRFQLITDLTGGFSYARQLSVFMEKVLAFLEVNGQFFTLLLDVVPETGMEPARYPDLLLLTEIRNADGSEARVCSWLKRIGCVAVACETDTRLDRPIELYQVRKVCDRVTVPPLTLVEYRAGTPPQRRYRLMKRD
jgi:hypothetical protein